MTELIIAIEQFLGKNAMTAYVVMMTIRLLEMYRILKPTGSIYLHCDPTASHYLKIVLDSIFDVRNFKNEIVWRRSFAHGDAKQGAKHFGRCTDSILFYTKTDSATWNPQYTPYSEEALKRDYKYIEEKTERRYRLAPVDGPGGASKGNPFYEFLGVKGYWRFNQEKMQKLYEEGLIVRSSTGKSLSQKMYLDEAKGRPVDNLWDDIHRISPNSSESLGYQTQKPTALLERIISASSNKGDMVLDPFCGCGTAIDASEKLERNWIGIDITHLAINLIKRRIKDKYPTAKFEVVGEPKDLEGAKQLAQSDRYQFEWWALSLIDARPINDKKKGSDRGIDGIIYLFDPRDKTTKSVLVQVKSGHVKSGDIRDFKGTLEREKVKFGVFVTLEEPTKDMKEESIQYGYEKSPLGDESIAKIQILTIKEILDGIKPKVLFVNVSYKKAEHSKKKGRKKEIKKGKNKRL
ncbi:MAG TPA: DNA methyltransferase [Candidatus Baltobacteraceae bacterium]|nr:DNA methyltransferase [Candidatus Baltobacteraceae bacterium]